jgi:UDP-3-O-acyl N-acetylglucosamine deacetylase
MEKQRTLKKKVSFSGKSLQNGLQVDMVCLPAPEGTGIVFKRVDLDKSPSVSLADAVFSTDHGRRSTVGCGNVCVQTVEHFLAALWACGIDDLLIEINAPELPAMDGSAGVFYRDLSEAGTVEHSAFRDVIKINEPFEVKSAGGSIRIEPYDGFRISYLIDYDIPSIGRQELDLELDAETFSQKVAPARTFCLKHEAEMLLKAGLGQGANTENTLVMGQDGPLDTTLRFKDEPLRHKILDLVGDLYLLGRRLECGVRAERSGHGLNTQAMKIIYERYIA